MLKKSVVVYCSYKLKYYLTKYNIVIKENNSIYISQIFFRKIVFGSKVVTMTDNNNNNVLYIKLI